MSDTSARPGRRLLSTLRTRFRLLWVAPLLAAIVLGCWAFASPIGAAPDDDFHLTSTWCANGARTDLCEPGPKASERYVPQAVLYAPCFSQDAEVSASCQQPYVDAGSDPTVLTHRGSFENNYPPLYYATMNLFASHDIIGSAMLMRFVNILLFVLITTALFVLLPAHRRGSLVWAWIITSVPLGLFLIASNNPSSWAIIGVGSSWLALLGYFETTGKRRIALGAIFALTALMAAGARGDAALYTVLGVGIVGLLTFAPRTVPVKRYLLLAILPVVMSVVAVVFFLSSQQSGVVVSGLGNGTAPGGHVLDPFSLLAYNLLNVQSLWAGVWGSWGLGWLDTTMPAIVSLGGLAVFVAVAFVGLARSSWRKTTNVVLLALVLWLLPAYVLVKGMNLVGQNVQPRYLLPLIVVMGGLAVLSVRSRTSADGSFAVPRFRVLQLVFVVLTLSMAQSVAMHMNLRRYLTGTDLQGWNLNAGYEWWWQGFVISPMALWFIGSVAFAALLTILVREMARPHAAIR